MAKKVLNLIPTDVGRLLGDVRLNLSLSLPDLGPLLAAVLDGAGPQEREVRDQQGRWCSLRIRPYLTKPVDPQVIYDLLAPPRVRFVSFTTRRRPAEADIEPISQACILTLSRQGADTGLGGPSMPELRRDAVDPYALGARIRDARESSGLTQQRFAERLAMSRTTVVAIEKGERRLKPAELIQMAAALGRNVSDLLQQGAPATGLGAQLRDALPSAAAAPVLLPYIEELQHLCEDYLRLEEICQAPLRRRSDPNTRFWAAIPGWRRRMSPRRSGGVSTWGKAPSSGFGRFWKGTSEFVSFSSGCPPT